jgi:hypothetical protein
LWSEKGEWILRICERSDSGRAGIPVSKREETETTAGRDPCSGGSVDEGTTPGACALGVAASKRQHEAAEKDASRSGPPGRSHREHGAKGAGGRIGQCRLAAARGAACAPSRIPRTSIEMSRRVTSFSRVSTFLVPRDHETAPGGAARQGVITSLRIIGIARRNVMPSLGRPSHGAYVNFLLPSDHAGRARTGVVWGEGRGGAP